MYKEISVSSLPDHTRDLVAVTELLLNQARNAFTVYVHVRVGDNVNQDQSRARVNKHPRAFVRALEKGRSVFRVHFDELNLSRN